jgi:hypothetical protein
MHLIDFINIRDISTQPSICLSWRKSANPHLFNVMEGAVALDPRDWVRSELHSEKESFPAREHFWEGNRAVRPRDGNSRP